MKIISGIYGGRRLEAPKNSDIRPTSDKIRGAIFNMIASRIDLDGAHILDAFCGSGALGLEALSRGGAFCTFIDQSRISLNLCKRNATTLDLYEQADFHLKDTIKFLRKASNIAYDLILLDPPYCKDLILPTLHALVAAKAITHTALIVIESEKQWTVPLPENFISATEKIYGDTKVALARYHDISPV